MKKKVLFPVLFVLLFALILPSQALQGRVVDNAGIFSAQQVEELNKRIDGIRERYGMDASIVTITGLGNAYSMRSYAENFFDTNDLGVGEERDGVLLLLKMTGGAGNRDYYIDGHGSRGTKVERAFDDETFLVFLRRNAYYDGARAFLDEVEARAEALTPVGRVKKYLPVFLIAGALIGLVTVLILRGRMKTAKSRQNAADYVLKDSFRLTRALDMYLYTTTTRSKIVENNSGSSHRGGFSGGGGGGHSGHGGKF